MYRKFTNYVAGRPSGHGLPLVEIESVDGSVVVAAPDSDLTELIAARDFVTQFDGTPPQVRLANSKRTLAERIAVVRSIHASFQNRQEELIDLVHKIHGTPTVYLADSCAKLRRWVSGLESFVQNVDRYSLARDGLSFDRRAVLAPYALVAAGNFEIYESFYLLAQTILSGTHFVIRPSAYDIATHVIFEILDDKGLADLGQKLTWDSIRQPSLIKHLLRFVAGASIFGADERIRRILVTGVLERHPGGQVEGRVIEDLSAGRRVRAYGSGNAMLVVLGNPEEAAKHFYYAKVLTKGNKCWVPDGAVVVDQYADAFYSSLIQLDRGNRHNIPEFRHDEIEAISAYIRDTVGKPDYGPCVQGEQAVGIILCRDLQPDSPFFAQEVTFPAAGIVMVRDARAAADALMSIISKRGQTTYLSIGYFGPEATFEYIRERVPSESYRVNESLAVDLMKPHQGSYFMLDPTISGGGFA
jgi:acyl-CoA reductase-like NAD-dependent aldehyde dehydrogenase